MAQTSTHHAQHTPMIEEEERALKRTAAPDTEPGLQELGWPSIGLGAALATWAFARQHGVKQIFVAAAGAGLIYNGLKPGFDKGFKRLLANTAATEPVEIDIATTIARPASELYQMWRDPVQIPRFFRHIKRVEHLGERLTRWVAEVPGDLELCWNAEITEDHKNELIAWRSLEGSELVSSGVVSFFKLDDGQTRVHLRLRYQPPGGEFGASIERFFKAIPEQILREELRAFKQLAEAGEVATVRGQPYGGTQNREQGLSMLTNR